MATRDKHRAYYAKRVGRMWQVWFMRQDGSSDANGAFEWRASSLQFYRKINAERLVNDLWQHLMMVFGLVVNKCPLLT